MKALPILCDVCRRPVEPEMPIVEGDYITCLTCQEMANND